MSNVGRCKPAKHDSLYNNNNNNNNNIQYLYSAL